MPAATRAARSSSSPSCPRRTLDGKHTVFGRVVEGIDVLAKLHAATPAIPTPPIPDKILEIKVLRKREHGYMVKKTGE